MVPACSSGTLTNVLPHRNAMPQTQDTTPHPVTVYRHGANLSLCYPSMWNVTLEYTATHFNVWGETQPGNPSPTFHTHQRTLIRMTFHGMDSYFKPKFRLSLLTAFCCRLNGSAPQWFLTFSPARRHLHDRPFS